MQRSHRPSARFDDLVSGSARVFDEIVRELVAWHPDEVVPVLDEAQRLSNKGFWAFGFVAYEAAPGFDPRLATAPPIPEVPLVWFGVSRAPKRAEPIEPGTERSYTSEQWVPEWNSSQHQQAVHTVQTRIAKGETYQCNLTTKLTSHVEGDIQDLYRDLALAQRGRYNAYLDIGRFAVASASPELFFELSGSQLLMRPMKGTAGRGRTTAEDSAAVSALLASAKERAENVMIVDLIRNDLARVAHLGSVKVPALFRAERYETVHQLTSDVTATVDPGASLADIFRALFPCGSITGAPKERTMELIEEIEDGPRGIYCGAIGMLAPIGSEFRARFSVAIRTVVADRETGTAVYGSGGGITWGSRAEAEYTEILTKAQVLDSKPEDFHLIETMRYEKSGVVRSLDAHLARAEDSARYFGFDFDASRVRRALTVRLSRRKARIRLLMFRTGRFEILVSDLPAPLRRPLRLTVHDDPIDTRQCWSRHKTSLRAPYARRLAAYPEFDDVIVTNERNEIMETCTGNIAALVDGVWVTPPLSSGCLPGIERQRLLNNGTLRELPLTRDLLRTAPLIAVINALRGWRTATFTENVFENS
uniref:aminodeoxychorismate synthase component I n=1 Tax=Rhodococcus qingshengii TaxID=334542 RepID=UPI001C4E22B0|nr:aminodeoxychorismate synthase component I [Rhodococcus qingshengii]